ncbi:MAG TPA: Gfo/Idh/MocA family oxidoreductase [Dongiaceae bacterium]|nr:Gfo/Idh/MocA family oxidoreductase [Dongiaceae bacterium]
MKTERIQISRRRFLEQSSFSAAGLWLGGLRGARAGQGSPNEKLNLGMIGVAHQAAYDLDNVSSENIVALCDVDDGLLAAASQKHPAAKTYNDFRRLLDRKDLDAVVVATPDHTHAVATVAALRSGRHVYCEKPLTRTISECRTVMEAARAAKRATQIGTQIHAGANYRRVVELVRSGAIGTVDDVHVWVDVTYGGQERPKDTPPVPAQLHYDLWLGPVQERPYSPEYLPARWRNWWAFGGGALGDFGCHYLDLPHWALGLQTPLTAEILEGPPVHPESVPPWLILRYAYPARESQPPIRLTWYHGGKRPPATLLPADLLTQWRSGVLFIGRKGMLLADYGRRLLLPEKEFAGFVPPPPSIPASIGHHAEWLRACKTGEPTTCNFDYSGALTETVLLGNVAYRAGSKLDWDSKRLRATNCAQAAQLVHHQYRAGWKI